jgi:DNA-binding response OmpR family regulator
MNQSKILIADDDSEIRSLLKKILDTEKWYDCEIFSHYIDLKSRTVKVTPDLLILDIHFKDSTIIDFLQYRATNEKLSKVPVIIMSGEQNKEIIKEVQTYDVDDYIMKPFQQKELLSLVQFHLYRTQVTEKKLDIELELTFPMEFSKASETMIIGESDLKLRAKSNYTIDCPKLEELNIRANEFVTTSESSFSAENDTFETVFKTRGTNENFLSLIRANKL